MKTFKDSEDREWSLSITVPSLLRVRDLCKMDLLQVVEGKVIDQLSADLVLLSQVIYALCKPAVDAKGLTSDEFVTALRGDALGAALAAMLEDLVNFFPSPGTRKALTAVLEASRRVTDKVEAATMAKLQAGELDSAIENALLQSKPPPQSVGDSSGNAPASSALVPESTGSAT